MSGLHHGRIARVIGADEWVAAWANLLARFVSPQRGIDFGLGSVAEIGGAHGEPHDEARRHHGDADEDVGEDHVVVVQRIPGQGWVECLARAPYRGRTWLQSRGLRRISSCEGAVLQACGVYQKR